MNIYSVPFKVLPIRYYALVPTCFPILEALQKIVFCDFVQLLLRCSFYLLNRRVASSFQGPIQFPEQEKSQGDRSREYDGCGNIIVLFLGKNSRTSNDVWTGALSWCKSQFLFFHKSGSFWRISDCFAQIAHNLQVIFIIDRSTLWQELMMHHAPAIEESCK